MKFSYAIALFIALSTAAAGRSYAQETNLWNYQYGTRSTLLGGAVIGSVTDMSATYYNPGALALFKEASLLLSASGYEYSAQTIEGGAGDGKDITTSSLIGVPDLVAGSLPFDWLGKQALAFSILQRSRANSDFEARGPIPPTTPGGTAAGELILENDMSEFWGGITWSSLLGENVGIGITTYLAVRNQDRRAQLLAQELETSGDVAASIIISSYSYEHVRLLWKAGIGVNLSPLTLGATITTPGVGLFGSGSSLQNVTSTGFDSNGDGTEDNVLAGNYQKDLESDYRSSWAFGAGAAYRVGDARIHFSGEFIDAVPFFDVVAAEPFVAQSSGDTVSRPLTHEAQDVFNYAIGLEYAFGEHTRGYASFSTDFSAGIPRSTSTLSIAQQDIYHLGAGAEFAVGRWNLLFGGVYAFGKDKVQEVFNVIDPGGLLTSLGDSEIRFTRITILFGFSFTLQ